MRELKGKVQTVLGLVDGGKLGLTLPHEHLFINTMCWYSEPVDSEGKAISRQPITLENLSWVRSHKSSNLDNMQITDEANAIREATIFKKSGGKTIVDVTPNSLGRNPSGLVNVARATGLNIIMGTAYYTESSFQPEMHMESRTDSDFADEFIAEITSGVCGIRAGLIGELGCSWPLTDNENRMLRGAAIAQQQTGAVMSVHFQGGEEDSPFQIVNLLTDAGADPHRIILCHMTSELPVSARNARARLAEMGCYLEFDLFGIDGIYPLETTPFQGANDFIRISEIIDLITDGFLNNILISQDVCFKIHLNAYGGQGYTHILQTILPLMRKRGLTQDQINGITMENPRRAFAFG